MDKDVAAEAGASNAAPATAAAPQAPADAAAATPANAAEDAYTGPVADMLALVASLNLSVAPPPSTEVIDSQTAAGTGVLPADAGVKPAADAPAKAGLADQGAGATATAFAAVADAAKAGVAAAGKFASATTATASTAPAADARGAADTLLPAAQLAAQPGAPAPQAQASDPAAAQLAAVKTRDGLPELQLIQEPPREAATLAAAPVQQASLQITEAATSVPGAVLRGQVGTPAWNQELGQKIVWMVAGAEQSATLTLNPPDLGPLQVVLRVSNDQLDATFTSAQPEVRQALEAALPRLREMMSATGVELANASVSAGLSNQQNGGNGEARMGRGGGGGGGGGSHGGGGGDGNGGLERGGAAAPRKVAQGMVDTFA
ncbi:flagellar hook-length control protein FliK [Janthinobacterium sp. CG_23.3]|uniref:flagellar hook-length control protein FliK n=1 Tax=Janthinobacterium sp. CG_23.3 TaxID=3349634 RepID=UPI0038D36FFC